MSGETQTYQKFEIKGTGISFESIGSLVNQNLRLIQLTRDLAESNGILNTGIFPIRCHGTLD